MAQAWAEPGRVPTTPPYPVPVAHAQAEPGRVPTTPPYPMPVEQARAQGGGVPTDPVAQMWAGPTRQPPPPRVTEAALPAIFGAVGAALVAVAALVFAYSGLVADAGVRRTVLVGVTALAAGTTLVVRRRGFVASANAVGGLTAVLGLIAVHVLSSVAHGSAQALAAASAAFAWAALLAAAGRVLHLRVWWGAGLLVAPLAVTVVTGATSLGLVWAIVLAGAAATAAGCAALERRSTNGPGTTVETVVLNLEAAVIGLFASGAVLGLVVGTASEAVISPTGDILAGGGVLVGLGLVAAVMGRLRHGAWTAVAGVYLVGAVAWMVMFAVSHTGPLTIITTGTIAAVLAWAAVTSFALRVSPGRCSSLLAGGWVVTATITAVLSVTTAVALAWALGDPFAHRSLGTPTKALVNPGWTNAWLPVAWLVVAVAWAWFATLPRAYTAAPPEASAGRPSPGSPAAWLSAPVDPDDIDVVVATPNTDSEVPFAHWLAIGPVVPGTRIVAARLRSTQQPVPLAQLNDPWRRRSVGSLGRCAGALAPVAAGASVAAAGLLPGTPMWVSLTIWLVAAAVAWAGARTLAQHTQTATNADVGPVLATPWTQAGAWFTRFSLRPGMWLVGLGLAALAAQYSWWSHPATLVVGVVVVAVTVAWAQLATPPVRAVVVGCAYAYALVVAGLALWWYPWGWTATWPSTIGALAVVSAAVAVVLGRTHRRVGHPVYFTLLGVGALPWFLAVTSMFAERTWGAAVACTAIGVVEAALLSSRRRPQPTVVRILATVGLIPTAAAVTVNVVPQLTDRSGAPVVLPVVAVLAVVGALVAEPWTARLAAGQMAPRLASQIRGALELSALATVVIAELLALVRGSAPGVVSLLVCATVAAGASYLATRPRRRQVWWLAWLAWSGVLWSALGIAGVTMVEAYTTPPTLVAAAIAFWFMPRSSGMVRLGGVATLAALAPTLVLTLVGQSPATRACVLVGAAAFLGLTALAVRGTSRAPLLPYAAAGIAASALGPFSLTWYGLGTRGPTNGDPWFYDAVATMAPAGRFGTAIALTALSAALVGWAGVALAAFTSAGARWHYAPAVAVVAIGTVLATAELASVNPGLPPAAVTWLIGAGLVGGGAGALTRLRATAPPTWFWWSAAYVTFAQLWTGGAVTVEWYALPFGAAMFVAGWVAVRRGVVGPDAMLAPVVVALLGPSTLTLLEDPATWRAIMLVLLSLGIMLVGARKMWKSLLALGIADMGIVVVVVFATASVSTTPWLITLLATGGLLLTLAVYAESRRNAPTS